MAFILTILVRESDFDLEKTGLTESRLRAVTAMPDGKFHPNVGHCCCGFLPGVSVLSEMVEVRGRPDNRRLRRVALASVWRFCLISEASAGLALKGAP
jgi:hypothetical protein